MSDIEECIHGLGPVKACVICNGRARREAAELGQRRSAGCTRGTYYNRPHQGRRRPLTATERTPLEIAA